MNPAGIQTQDLLTKIGRLLLRIRRFLLKMRKGSSEEHWLYTNAPKFLKNGAVSLIVSVPDPNPPQHGSHLVSRWKRSALGWFGSGTETISLTDVSSLVCM